MLGLDYKWIQVVRSARNPASKSSSGTKSLIRFRLVLSERSEPPSDSWVTELVSSSQCQTNGFARVIGSQFQGICSDDNYVWVY